MDIKDGQLTPIGKFDDVWPSQQVQMLVTLPCWYLALVVMAALEKTRLNSIWWLWNRGCKSVWTFENHFELPYLDLFSPVLPELSPALGTSGETGIYIYIFFFQSIPKQQRKSPFWNLSLPQRPGRMPVCALTAKRLHRPWKSPILAFIGSVICPMRLPTAVRCCLMWGFCWISWVWIEGAVVMIFMFWDETTPWLSKSKLESVTFWALLVLWIVVSTAWGCCWYQFAFHHVQKVSSWWSWARRIGSELLLKGLGSSNLVLFCLRQD